MLDAVVEEPDLDRDLGKHLRNKRLVARIISAPHRSDADRTIERAGIDINVTEPRRGKPRDGAFPRAGRTVNRNIHHK